jgi:hypothetical protein
MMDLRRHRQANPGHEAEIQHPLMKIEPVTIIHRPLRCSARKRRPESAGPRRRSRPCGSGPLLQAGSQRQGSITRKPGVDMFIEPLKIRQQQPERLLAGKYEDLAVSKTASPRSKPPSGIAAASRSALARCQIWSGVPICHDLVHRSVETMVRKAKSGECAAPDLFEALPLAAHAPAADPRRPPPPAASLSFGPDQSF